jgi:hypothetical protein
MLVRLNANRPELLMVLDRPEIPLHTKLSATTNPNRQLGAPVS